MDNVKRVLPVLITLLVVVLLSGVLGAVISPVFIIIAIISAIALLLVFFFGLLLPVIRSTFGATKKSMDQDKEEKAKW